MCIDLRTWRTDRHLSDIINGLDVSTLRFHTEQCHSCCSLQRAFGGEYFQQSSQRRIQNSVANTAATLLESKEQLCHTP